jgi:hypothetical protein
MYKAFRGEVLPLHKINCTRETASKLAFRPFALSLQKPKTAGGKHGNDIQG